MVNKKIWEYKLDDTYLSELGKKEWELVSVIPEIEHAWSRRARAFLKKQKKE